MRAFCCWILDHFAWKADCLPLQRAESKGVDSTMTSRNQWVCFGGVTPTTRFVATDFNPFYKLADLPFARWLHILLMRKSIPFNRLGFDQCRNLLQEKLNKHRTNRWLCIALDCWVSNEALTVETKIKSLLINWIPIGVANCLMTNPSKHRIACINLMLRNWTAGSPIKHRLRIWKDAHRCFTKTIRRPSFGTGRIKQWIIHQTFHTWKLQGILFTDVGREMRQGWTRLQRLTWFQ